MRLVVVGAGAVGITLGSALEQLKHEVLFLVRPGRKSALARFILIDARSGKPHKRERANVAEVGTNIAPFEWVLLCVRGDQIDEGIATLKAHARPDATVVVVAASLDGIERVRAEWKGGPVLQMFPMFMAWSEEPSVWKWFQLPVVPSLISSEGDDKAAAAATELAAAFEAAHLPARAVPSLRSTIVPVLGPGVALLAGWELAGWDVDRLGRDGALRDLTAGAMHEAAAALRGEAKGWSRLMGFVPAGALSLLLRAMPRLASQDVRAMWTHHGPKIQQQTREILDGVLLRAATTGDRHLRALRERLLAAAPLTPVTAPPAPPAPPSSPASSTE